jgi:flagellar hook assembly protein FlgD
MNMPHLTSQMRMTESLLAVAPRILLFAFLILNFALIHSHAVTINSASVSPAVIPYETNSPNSTVITYNLSGAASVEIDIYLVQSTSGTPVATLTQAGAAGANTLSWNALWPIGADQGRMDGTYTIVISATDSSGTTSFSLPNALQITSIDTHNVAVQPSLDANQQPAFPYAIQYSLAKPASVTAVIKNSTGTVVRTLISNAPQFGESTIPTISVPWNGLSDQGYPVPLGIYTLAIDALDPTVNPADHAIERTRSIAVGSLANLNADPQTIFEQNAYVYPNPVRNGQATFKFLVVRDGAVLHLRIYTLTGTLVRDETFSGLTTGNMVTFAWDATNASGHKVGRGLYYYVLREDDSQGTLQTVKKFAVIP